MDHLRVQGALGEIGHLSKGGDLGGAGGLDIYSYDLNGDPETEEVKHLPKPINTRSDDFCFIINEAGTKGYFSSRRPRGKGDDDIYFFTVEQTFLRVLNPINLLDLYLNLLCFFE